MNIQIQVKAGSNTDAALIAVGDDNYVVINGQIPPNLPPLVQMAAQRYFDSGSGGSQLYAVTLTG